MANKIFRQVLCSERLPETKTETYLTEVGAATLYSDNKWLSMVNKQPEWWLEEVELPSENEKHDLAISYSVLDAIEGTASLKCDKKKFEAFKAGFNKSIELIKGEGLNNPTTN